MANNDREAAYSQLRQLVAAGAELEQRHLDGTPVAYTESGEADAIWALAHDLFEVEDEPDTLDGYPTVWFCPLFPNWTSRLEDGSVAFDSGFHQMRPLRVARFDLLGNGNVGMQHPEPEQTYSVVRPLTADNRRALVAAWAAGPITA